MKFILLLLIFFLSFPLNNYAAPIQQHRIAAENLQSDGWHLAKSTEGDFSILLPGPFNDLTIKKDGIVLYMVSSLLKNGTKFVAMYSPNGANQSMLDMFEKDLNSSRMTVSKFKSYKSIFNRSEMKDKTGLGVNYTLRFKTNHGIYILMISTPIRYDAFAFKNKDKFFNSIKIS